MIIGTGSGRQVISVPCLSSESLEAVDVSSQSLIRELEHISLAEEDKNHSVFLAILRKQTQC